MYYGIQLKPLDEYRKGFDPVTGEFTLGEDSFKALFDDSKQAIDDEVEANFQKLQKERRRRVAEAVQTAGVDEEPVSYTHLDVYKRQTIHGIVRWARGNAAGKRQSFNKKTAVHMDRCFKVLAKTYFPGPLPAKYLRHERA